MKNEFLLDEIFAKAKADPQRIVFPEANKENMMKAAFEAASGGYGKCILVGDPEELKRQYTELNIDHTVFEFVDINDEEYRDSLVSRYMQLPQCMFSEKALKRRMKKPLYFALVMEALDDADVTIGGFEATTADMIQASVEILGMEDGVDTVSSVTLCAVPGFEGSEGEYIALGDAAVCTNPTPSELASIAISSCETIRALTGWEPRCAMLSFSTNGSASHDDVDKVVEAVRIANERRPDLKIDGEFQVDTAVVPRTAAIKLNRESEVAGKANILIFPDLDAGNIGAKILNFIAGVKFPGVFLQGFKKVSTDSSRSASPTELLRNIVFSAVRAAELKKRKNS